MSAPTIDFLRPRRTPALGWCLLLVGAASMAASAWQLQQWTSQRAREQALIQEQQDARQRAIEAASRPHVPTVDERRLQRIAPLLRQPWLPTLRTIENATENPVFLLALSIDPSSGRVQLDGEAPSFDHALAYVQRLSDRGALANAHLASHETVNDPSGRSLVRFTVLARWSAP